jgi:hypothetical protein
MTSIKGARHADRDRDGGRAQAMKLPVFKHLLDINVGFEQVIRGLAALRKHDAFLARELKRFSALAKESRAATNSYLMGVMERNETQEAGRRFGKRLEREQGDE